MSVSSPQFEMFCDHTCPLPKDGRLREQEEKWRKETVAVCRFRGKPSECPPHARNDIYHPDCPGMYNCPGHWLSHYKRSSSTPGVSNESSSTDLKRTNQDKNKPKQITKKQKTETEQLS